MKIDAENSVGLVDYSNRPHESYGISWARENYFEQFLKKKRSIDIVKKNRCELKLVADYEFFRVIGNGNYANAARYLVRNCLFFEYQFFRLIFF